MMLQILFINGLGPITYTGCIYLDSSNGCIIQILNLTKDLDQKLLIIFRKLKRKEQSIYKPTDLWIFLSVCFGILISQTEQ